MRFMGGVYVREAWAVITEGTENTEGTEKSTWNPTRACLDLRQWELLSSAPSVFSVPAVMTAPAPLPGRTLCP